MSFRYVTCGLIGLGVFRSALAVDCDQVGWIEAKRVANAVEDPFADPFGENLEKDGVVPKSFRTTGGYDIEPWSSFWEVKPERQPKIPAPDTFSSSFREPKSVWRVQGGFFASYNAGEFGAGLFYADGKATSWKRLVRAHVDSLYDFSEDVFIAVGGLAHMGIERGEVYRVERIADGGWDVRLVFKSHVGVTKVVGESKTQMFLEGGIAEKLMVFVICSHQRRVEELFGVTAQGVVHALGARELDKGEDNGK